MRLAASPIQSARKDLDGSVRRRDHSVAQPPAPEPRHTARAAEMPALPRRVETPPARCWLATSRASLQRSATRHGRCIPIVRRCELIGIRQSRSLTACETARCRRQATAGQRRAAGPSSVPASASRGPGCNPPLRSAPRWRGCSTSAAYRRGLHGGEGADVSTRPCPHEAAQKPVLVRAPTPSLFASGDQVFDLRRRCPIRIFGGAFVVG